MTNTIVYESAKILIVDDQPTNIDLVKRILQRAGYTEIRTTTQPRQAIPIFEEFQPDIILLDLHMPDMDGKELLQSISKLIPEHIFLPIIILTADITPKAKQEALLLGAHDFMSKPLDRVEVLLRIRNLLRSRFLNITVQQYNQRLEEKVTQRTHETQIAQSTLINCLNKATKYRDGLSGEHTNRVQELSSKLAIALGYSKKEADMIGEAASLHDIGKIGVPDNILFKSTGLTTHEFNILKKHTTIGKDIIANTHTPILQYAYNIIYTHHERWDGSGYPRGLKGEEIPLEGQIVSIVDIYDNLTHQHENNEVWSTERALVEITKKRGEWFSPEIVSAFLNVVMEVEDSSEKVR